MIRLFISLMLACFAATTFAQDVSWVDKTLKIIDESSSLEKGERIQVLSKYLHAGSYTGTGFYRDEQDQQVFDRAQSELLAIPGHAEYWVEPLKEYRAWRVKTIAGENPKVTPMIDRKLINYRSVFVGLSQLPSTETMKVLCEFVVNDKDLDDWVALTKKTEGDDLLRLIASPPLAVNATVSLRLLPLKSKPTMEWDEKTYEPVFMWRNWCRQVLEGRRTFSFEGDPNEYDLNGIARDARNPDIPRVAKRFEIHDEVPPKSGKSSSSVPTPWMASAITLILTGVSWIVLKKRKSV